MAESELSEFSIYVSRKRPNYCFLVFMAVQLLYIVPVCHDLTNYCFCASYLHYRQHWLAIRYNHVHCTVLCYIFSGL